MKILVCGGRDYDRYEVVSRTLLSLFPPATDDMDTWLPPDDTVIIHGGAKGADMLADQWAVVHYVQTQEYKAHWNQHGKAAGPLRNIRMLREGKPDLVVAFPGGKGTAHMVKIAKAAGVEVLEVIDD